MIPIYNKRSAKVPVILCADPGGTVAQKNTFFSVSKEKAGDRIRTGDVQLVEMYLRKFFPTLYEVNFRTF